MSQCTAPIYGHRTERGRANCPVCGRRLYSNRNVGLHYQTYPNHSFSFAMSRGSSRGNISHTVAKSKAKWSPAGSSVVYTQSEILALTPIRESIEKRVQLKTSYDVFLCHAWDDRRTIARELYDSLMKMNVSVWFSEKNISLGTSFVREIDRGLAKSRAGIVLVTSSFLKRVENEGVSDKELSVLLQRDLLIPVVYNTSYDDLREVSPMLASRNGLNLSEDSMDEVAEKIAELVHLI